MPNLCIIPARAVADRRLTEAQLRVLLAVSIYTRADGRGAFPSARTIASEACVSRTTTFNALAKLEELGYIRRTPRWEDGRQTSTMYDVLLHDPAEGEGTEAAAPPRPGTVGRGRVQAQLDGKNDLGRNDKSSASADHQALVNAISSLLAVYPTTKHVPTFPALIRPMRQALTRAPLATILRGAEGYANACRQDGTDPMYVTSPQRWLMDERWTQYDVPRIYGRTRQDWARSGQDVAEFDRLWAALTNQEEESDVEEQQYQAL